MCWGLQGAGTLGHVRLFGENDLGATGLDQQSTVQSQVARADKFCRPLLDKRLSRAQAELRFHSPWPKPELGSDLTRLTKRGGGSGGIA